MEFTTQDMKNGATLFLPSSLSLSLCGDATAYVELQKNPAAAGGGGG